MQAMETIKAAAKKAGIPLTKIGPAIGKSAPYVNAAISRGSNPQADTLADMLAPCGYVLAAIPADEVPASALVIDPRVGVESRSRKSDEKVGSESPSRKSEAEVEAHPESPSRESEGLPEVDPALVMAVAKAMKAMKAMESTI